MKKNIKKRGFSFFENWRLLKWFGYTYEDDNAASNTYLNNFSATQVVDTKTVFAASRGTEEQEEIYPLTVSEIADAQRADKHLRKYFTRGANRQKADTA